MERSRRSIPTSERLRQLAEIARCLIEGSLEDRLTAVVERAPKALGVRSASIFLVREDFAGFVDRLALPGVELIPDSPRPAGLTAEVLNTRKALAVDDTAKYPGVNPRVVEAGIRSFLAVPLNSSAGCLGVLYLNQSVPQRFSPADLRLAEAIGDMIGQAVENARLHERERQALQSLEAERHHLASLMAALDRSLAEADLLRDVAAGAAEAEDLDRLLRDVLERLRLRLIFSSGAILLSAGRNLVVRAASGLPARRSPGQRLKRDDQLVWRALATGEPLFENDHAPEGMSVLAIPLRWRGNVLGVLELAASQPDAFDVPDLNLMRKVAEQLAGWIYIAARGARQP